MNPHPITPEQAAAWQGYLVPDGLGQGGQRVAGCHKRIHPIGRLPIGGLFRRRRREQGQDEEYLKTWDGEDCPVLPDAELVTNESKRIWEWDDIDQNGYPACTACGWANAIELFLACNGRAKTKLDWYRLWYKLTGGRGGIDIGTALAFILKEGYPLADGSGVVFIDEAWEAPSVASFLSGLEMGCFGAFGHDSHCECATSVIRESNRLEVDARNSWAEVQRWHVMPASAIDVRTYGAYLARDCKIRPIDTTGWADSN